MRRQPEALSRLLVFFGACDVAHTTTQETSPVPFNGGPPSGLKGSTVLTLKTCHNDSQFRIGAIRQRPFSDCVRYLEVLLRVEFCTVGRVGIGRIEEYTTHALALSHW